MLFLSAAVFVSEMCNFCLVGFVVSFFRKISLKLRVGD